MDSIGANLLSFTHGRARPKESSGRGGGFAGASYIEFVSPAGPFFSLSPLLALLILLVVVASGSGRKCSSLEKQQITLWNNSNPITKADILENQVQSIDFHNLRYRDISHEKTRSKNKSTTARERVAEGKETLEYYADMDAYIIEKYNAYLEDTKKRVLVWEKTCKGGSSVSCFPEKRRGDHYYTKLVKRAINSVSVYKYKYAVKQELTVDRTRYGLQEAWMAINHEFNRYLTGLFAEIGHRIPYVAGVELHADGYPHIHIIFFGVKRIADWRKLIKRWGMGFQFIKPCSPQKGVDYALKYVTKSLSKVTNKRAHAYLWYFGRRIYHSSRGVMTPLNEVNKDRVTEDEKYALVGLYTINRNFTNGFKDWVLAFGDMILSSGLCWDKSPGSGG